MSWMKNMNREEVSTQSWTSSHKFSRNESEKKSF